MKINKYILKIFIQTNPETIFNNTNNKQLNKKKLENKKKDF